MTRGLEDAGDDVAGNRWHGPAASGSPSVFFTSVAMCLRLSIILPFSSTLVTDVIFIPSARVLTPGDFGFRV